jgi:hypothetical protein
MVGLSATSRITTSRSDARLRGLPGATGGRQVSRNVLHCYSTQKIEEAAVVTASEDISEHLAGETLGEIVEER